MPDGAGDRRRAAARGPGRRLDRRRRLARRRARGRPGRHRQPAPPRAAAGRAPRPRRSRSCAATSTPACASSPRGSSTRSSSPPPACARLGRERRDRLRDPGRDDGPRPGPGRAGRSRCGPATRRRPPRSAAIFDRRAARELTAERAAVRLLEASCDDPGRRLRPGRRGRGSAIDGFVGLPDGSEWLRDRVEGDAGEPAAAGEALAERLLGAGARELLDRAEAMAHERDAAAGPGVVYLVGAGPGDPGLMTARSLELIAAADAIFYDRLIPPGALDGAREDAELVYVGKQPGVPSVPQEEIGERLIEARPAPARASSGSRAATRSSSAAAARRAKTLRAAGVEFEVVPGVTAGVAATAYAGIPVTHRDDASAVAFVTGHEDPEKPRRRSTGRRSPASPARSSSTWASRRLAENAAALIAGGRDPDEPAAAIERGHLARPAHRQSRPWARSPRRSTREEHQGAGADRLRRGRRAPRGARLARAPPAARPPRRRHPRPRPGQRPRRDPARPRRRGGRAAGDPDRAAHRDAPRSGGRGRAIDAYALVCLTSPNGVRPAVRGDGRARASTPARSPAPRSPRSARAPRGRCARAAIIADIVPERFVAEALVEALARGRGRGRPRARRPRRRGPRRPPRRAARARRRGRRRRPLRDGPRGARRGGDRGRPGRRLRHLHLLLDRTQPDRGARRPLPAPTPASSRSAR